MRSIGSHGLSVALGAEEKFPITDGIRTTNKLFSECILVSVPTALSGLRVQCICVKVLN